MRRKQRRAPIQKIPSVLPPCHAKVELLMNNSVIRRWPTFFQEKQIYWATYSRHHCWRWFWLRCVSFPRHWLSIFLPSFLRISILGIYFLRVPFMGVVLLIRSQSVGSSAYFRKPIDSLTELTKLIIFELEIEQRLLFPYRTGAFEPTKQTATTT